MDKLVINLTDDNIEEHIKKTKKLIRQCDKKNLELEFIYNNKKLTKKDINNPKLKDITTIMIAINKKDKYERYEYIYDTVCSYLDERISEGYCEFIDDICIRDRNKNNGHKNGCCECKGRGKCKYLIDSKCTLGNCMACKLFTCKTLRKKGIIHRVDDYPLTKYFFTSKQKDILRFSYWTPREIVLDRLMTNTYVRP